MWSHSTADELDQSASSKCGDTVGTRTVSDQDGLKTVGRFGDRDSVSTVLDRDVWGRFCDGVGTVWGRCVDETVL
ncbi:unnamed protein product [Gadus morhua 'NCC']